MIVPLNPMEFRHRAASLYGQKVGVVDGDLRFTYGEYDQRVNRLANALRDLGVREGQVVSFLTYNTHQLLEAYYGVPQIKAVLNPLNIRLSDQELAYILQHAQSRVLCFHQDFLPMVEKMRDELPSIDHYLIMESSEPPPWTSAYEKLLSAASPEADIDLDDIDENAVVELFYTSGTTGKPKGVAITNRSLYIHTLSVLHSFQVSDDDSFLHVVPLYHVNGWGTPQFLTAAGGKHVMMRKVDFGDMLRLIEEERITKILGVPTIFKGLLQHPDLQRYDLSSLQECYLGGAPTSTPLIEEVEEKLGCRAIVGYGLTETCPVITLARPKPKFNSDPALRRTYQAKTGLPLVGVRMRVVDQDGNDVPRDEKTLGEIIVRGNQVMREYFKDEEATQAALRGGWLHTGDMAVVDQEGYITILDRKKDIIISGGENISSVEIENVIRSHPAVDEVAVIGVPDETWGEVPKALIVLNPGQKAAEEDLIQHVRQSLASFKVPKSAEFRSSLPRGGTGKILKRQLKAPYWEGYAKNVN